MGEVVAANFRRFGLRRDHRLRTGGMGTVVPVSFEEAEPEISLSKKQLAAKLRFSCRHIEKLGAEGMPSRPCGRRRVYKVSEVLRWFEETGRPHNRERLFKELAEQLRQRSRRGRVQATPEDEGEPEPPPISA